MHQPVEIAVGPERHNLDRRGQSQPGDLESRGQAPVLDGSHLVIDDQAEAFLEGEAGYIRW